MGMVQIKDGQMTRVGLWTGTVIKLEDGKRFKITKLNPVNVKLMDPTGKDGWSINRAYAERHIDEDQSWDGPAPKTEYDKYLETVEAGITLGTAVKLKDDRLKSKYGTDTYVCIGMQSKGTLKLAKLGGDNGGYLHSISAGQLEVVTV